MLTSNRGHSLGCTFEYFDQSTVCDVKIVWLVAGRDIGKYKSVCQSFRSNTPSSAG